MGPSRAGSARLSGPGMARSSKASPRAKRCVPAVSAASARRLVEPARTVPASMPAFTRCGRRSLGRSGAFHPRPRRARCRRPYWRTRRPFAAIPQAMTDHALNSRVVLGSDAMRPAGPGFHRGADPLPLSYAWRRLACRVRWPDVGLRFAQDIEYFYSASCLEPMTIEMRAGRSTRRRRL